MTAFLDRLSVSPADDDGFVSVTVLLPADLVRDYCHFLESLANFFETVDRKSRILRAQVSNETRAVQDRAAEQRLAEYHSRLTSSFDSYISRGLDRKEAVKKVAADLRAIKHPWSAVDLVRSELVKRGRGGRSGRPRFFEI